MKALIRVLVVVFSFALLASAQSIRSQGLVLTGSVISVTPRVNSKADKPLILYDVGLYLQLRNDSNAPLVFFRPSDPIVGRRITFQDSLNAGTETGDISLSSAPFIIPYRISSLKYFEPQQADAYFAQYCEMLALGMEHPNTPAPKGALMKLEPGEYFEFPETMTVEDGFKLEIKPRQSLQELSRNSPIPAYPALRIEYKLSLKKYHPNDALLKTVQERWKKIGHLVVDRDGDFSIQSDLILTRPGS